MNRAQRRAAKLTPAAPGSRERCPKCKSHRTATAPQAITKFYAREITVCGTCGSAWEPMPPGEPRHPDEPTMAFQEPCDNCAFRPGSPEQANTAEWRELMASLKAGASFHCHKGVPIEPGSEHGFAYPLGPDGKGDRAKLRTCRGFLNAWGRWFCRDTETEGAAS